MIASILPLMNSKTFERRLKISDQYFDEQDFDKALAFLNTFDSVRVDGSFVMPVSEYLEWRPIKA